MNPEAAPPIGVVIIGINVKDYADGGSTDGSPDLARTFAGVSVIELRDPAPTPGRGRNAGFRALATPLVQFLDADTILAPLWFEKALPFFNKERVAAVCGRRLERYPQKNLYHMIGNAEWTYEEGPCRYFGGDALVLRSVLEETGGYDAGLVAGEDPELSYRIRQKGWVIYRIPEDMTTHDLNMTRFRQYLKRAYRTGHAYAEVGFRYAFSRDRLWLRELLRVSLGACVPPVILILGIVSGKAAWGLTLAVVLAFRPLLKVPAFRRAFDWSTFQACLYALHLCFVVYPQFAGVLRYFYGRVTGNPLQNKGYRETAPE
jgi:cellulose synthase/poly-beta-1,6-N-acetylglucosamine synthase-like glycosyltransferase